MPAAPDNRPWPMNAEAATYLGPAPRSRGSLWAASAWGEGRYVVYISFGRQPATDAWVRLLFTTGVPRDERPTRGPRYARSLPDGDLLYDLGVGSKRVLARRLYARQ